MPQDNFTWRTFIEHLAEDYQLFPPAHPSALARVERELHVALPEELKTLLTETNGLLGRYDDVIWSAQNIVERNLEFRRTPDFAEVYMPFDPLLFFGDAGNGDQFAFIINAGAVRRPDVFIWDHETDSRSWYAPSLRNYLEQRLTGK